MKNDLSNKSKIIVCKYIIGYLTNDEKLEQLNDVLKEYSCNSNDLTCLETIIEDLTSKSDVPIDWIYTLLNTYKNVSNKNNDEFNFIESVIKRMISDALRYETKEIKNIIYDYVDSTLEYWPDEIYDIFYDSISDKSNQLMPGDYGYEETLFSSDDLDDIFSYVYDIFDDLRENFEIINNKGIVIVDTSKVPELYQKLFNKYFDVHTSLTKKEYDDLIIDIVDNLYNVV